MSKTMKQILKIKNAQNVNTFLYYLSRVWVIGKLIPESLYADLALKNVLGGFVEVLIQLYKGFCKALYVGGLVFFPAFLLLADGSGLSNAAPVMIHMLFFLSCLIGPFTDSEVFKVTREKFLCLKYMKMEGRRFVRASLAIRYIPHFFWFLPCVLVIVLAFGGTVWESVSLFLMLISYRFAGEAFFLWFFEKTGKILSRNYPFQWVLIAVGMVLSYYPLFVNGGNLTGVLTSVPFVCLSVLIGGLCLYYVGWGYEKYAKKLPRTLDEKYLFSAQVSKGKQTGFADVAMKESDLEMDKEVKNSLLFSKLSGFSYLNALFFKRHRRQLRKPVLIRVGVIALLFVGGVALYLADSSMAAEVGPRIPSTLPAFVFVMYFCSVAEKACRAMFYNCDISLLRYGFYRNPKTILSNFQIRLLRIVGYNLAIGIALSFAVSGLYALYGGSFFDKDMVMFVCSILLLSVFFSVHHLFLYYVFQPYTTELDVKNPFFKVINGAVYMLCFLCLQIKVAGSSFAFIVLGVTLLYVAAALILVYRYAPRNFRVK